MLAEGGVKSFSPAYPMHLEQHRTIVTTGQWGKYPMVLPAHSLAMILGRVANPVEPLGFLQTELRLPAPMAEPGRDGLRKHQDPFDELTDRQANEFEPVHGWNGFCSPRCRSVI